MTACARCGVEQCPRCDSTLRDALLVLLRTDPEVRAAVVALVLDDVEVHQETEYSYEDGSASNLGEPRLRRRSEP